MEETTQFYRLSAEFVAGDVQIPIEGWVADAVSAAVPQLPELSSRRNLNSELCAKLIEVLLSEAYEKGRDEGLVGSPLFQKIYYSVRPLLNVRVRRLLQKISLRDWNKRTFPNWPVDRTVDSIREQALVATMKAKGLDRIPFIWFWPDGHQAAFVMTHDVEAHAGLEFCPTLMDWDEQYGMKASFQVVPEERYHVSELQLQTIRNRGFEVNVHDLNHDGLLFKRHERFLRRVRKINEYGVKFGARGFRAGALYRNQKWFGSLNFEYEMSVPNVGHLDAQHGGCCTIFPYFVGNILELPVTMIQDYSLFNILNDYSISVWQHQLEIIRQHHGLAQVITHPDYVKSAKAQKTYHALLSYLAEERERQKLWMTLPGEVNDWWRQRSRMRLRHDGKQWEIQGEGNSRARIAYAELHENGLRYVLNEQQHPTQLSGMLEDQSSAPKRPKFTLR